MKHWVAGLGILAALAATPKDARAQAWAGEEGQLSASLLSAFQFASGVFYGDAGLITDLDTQNYRNTLALQFTPLKRLTVGADVSIDANRYTGLQVGANPEIRLGHGPNDDGDWHGAFSDANFNVRYQLTELPVALTPMLNVKIPVTDYATQGYAAPGTGLKELGIGLNIGRIGIVSDRVFAEGGYTYTFVERLDVAPETEEYNVSYSRVNASVGAVLGTRWVAYLGVEYRLTHDGVAADGLNMLPNVVLDNHDPILKRDYLAITGGAGFQATDEFNVGLGFGIIPVGDNVTNATLVALTLAWDHQLMGGGDDAAAAAADEAE